MKKILFLLVTILIVSCENDRAEVQDVEETANLSVASMESFTNSYIGHNKDGQFVLDVKESSVLKAVGNFSMLMDLELEPESFKVEEIEEEMYLRIYSQNDQVSTVALLLNEEGNYLTGSTICTSSLCASGGGCIPDGVYCTECSYGKDGNLLGDCKRTTSDDR